MNLLPREPGAIPAPDYFQEYSTHLPAKILAIRSFFEPQRAAAADAGIT
jgi:hypothetical protein